MLPRRECVANFVLPEKSHRRLANYNQRITSVNSSHARFHSDLRFFSCVLKFLFR